MPLILTTIAVTTAVYGVKKGADAHSDSKRARTINEDAQNAFKKSQGALKRARKETRKKLVDLGKRKISAMDDQVGRFVAAYAQLKAVELGGKPLVDGLTVAAPTSDELRAMKQVSLEAGELVSGGLQALGAGALVGVASYGGAMTFAAASTGTPIALLSGAAAKSATLAWFGGGSLAAGGGGMATGVAVLGGLVAGPVLAVGGAVFAAKARKSLAQAKSNRAAAARGAEQMKTAGSLVNGIGRAAKSWDFLIKGVASRMDVALEDLERVIASSGTDYRAFTEDERRRVFVAVQFAQMLKLLLDTPLLTKNGSLAREGGRVRRQAREFLQAPESAVSGTT